MDSGVPRVVEGGDGGRMNIHLCSFGAGLDEMKRKDQADPLKVLRVLAKSGRYSVFEATDNQTIARTMDRLRFKEYRWRSPSGFRKKTYGVLLEATGGQYPWTNVALTDGGKRLLEDNPE